MILPDAMLGVLGGGQLGRMFTMAARTMGYQVLVLDPDPHSPAGSIANEHLQAGYQDPQALEQLAQHCAAITIEFENIPVESLRILEQHCPVRPSASAVAIAQDRIREKTFLRDHGLDTAPFQPILSSDDLASAPQALPLPGLLKTAGLGYDGKGQVAAGNIDEALSGFETLGRTACVLEQKVDLERELSVILARSVDGATAVYPVAENIHEAGILDITVVPAREDPAIATQAVEMACRLADELDYCGVLAVEFFHTRDGKLLINEIAPRPHNSGHYTVDACLTSQFEQQVRTLCGLPPGDTKLLSPVVMVNLLGDLWTGGTPHWDRIFDNPRALLHLYGKRQARAGRKMGHFNCLAPDTGTALRMAEDIRKSLATPTG